MRMRCWGSMAALVGLATAGCASEPHPRPASTPAAAPRLLSSSPAEGEGSVARTAWVVLDLDGALDPKAEAGFSLACAGAAVPFTIARLDGGRRAVVNPSKDLPDASPCALSWRGPTGPTSLHFSTAPRGTPAHVLYDRESSASFAPWPDDALLVPDATTRTGSRVVASAVGAGARHDLLSRALTPSLALDGFSPIALFVVELDAAVDASTLPRTPAESLDPLATVGLFDLDPSSPDAGARVPFDLAIDDRPSASGAPSHVLRVFPARPLDPGRSYGFVVTRRALVDPSRPLDPSAFELASLTGAAKVDPVSTRAADAGRDVVARLEAYASPPLHIDDVALALRITTRSLDDVPRDMLSIRATLDASPPAAFSITGVTADPDPDVAAVVTGTFEAPLFIGADGSLSRGADGAPVLAGTESAPFALSLPVAALAHPVPAVMLQHGHVSSADAIVAQIGKGELAPVGVAGIGFTDIMMRRPALVNTEFVLDGLLGAGQIPDYETQTWAEQIAFLRLLPVLEASLDVLPLGADGTPAPDGRPDLDASAPPVFAGFSAGSFHGVGLLPYAPEIRAAVLAVGAGHWSAKTMHQKLDAVHDALVAEAPDLTRADVYAIFSLAQGAFDAQDPLVHARFARRAPVLPGRGPSILLTEGIGDTLVPSLATRAAAYQLGLPHMRRVAVSVPLLDVEAPPLTANLDAETTGAFLQLVPLGIDGVAPTPACAATGETVGHYCGDVSKAVADARLGLFESAFTGAVPTIPPVDN